MTKKKEQKKKERERRVAKEKLAAQKKAHERAKEEGASTAAPKTKKVFQAQSSAKATSFVPATAAKRSFTQRRMGSGG